MRFPGKIVDVLEESHTVAFLQVDWLWCMPRGPSSVYTHDPST